MNHWTDWFFIIVLIGLEAVCVVVTPFKRYVGAANFVTQSIKYPYKHNTIPFQAVPVCKFPFVFKLGVIFCAFVSSELFQVQT
jgi:hypothetical protein